MIAAIPDVWAEHDITKQLSAKSRCRVVDWLVVHLVQLFGLYPPREKKIMVAKSALAVFPCLKCATTTNDGIVSIVDSFCYLKTYLLYLFVFRNSYTTVRLAGWLLD